MGEPRHPYMQMSNASFLEPDLSSRLKQVEILGEIPSLASPPSRCRFHTSCPNAQPRYSELLPELRDLGNQHLVECHYAEEISNTPRKAKTTTQ